MIPGASALLLAVASNVDNAAIGMAYGNKRIRIGVRTNLFIALISGLGTFLSMSVGREINQSMSLIQANHLGSLTLIVAGLWGLWGVFKREQKASRRARLRSPQRPTGIAPTGLPEESELLQELFYETFLNHPERADRDHSGYLDINEAISLAFGLSVNNLTMGIGGGISGLSVGVTTGLVIAFSFLGLLSGYRLGYRQRIEMSALWAGGLSGGLVILLGIYEYFVF